MPMSFMVPLYLETAALYLPISFSPPWAAIAFRITVLRSVSWAEGRDAAKTARAVAKAVARTATDRVRDIETPEWGEMGSDSCSRQLPQPCDRRQVKSRLS